MRRIGYVKAKTPEQREEQAKELLCFGASEIVIEKGNTLLYLIKGKLRRGDKLYITDLTRLSRDVTEVGLILENLYSRGVRLYIGGVKQDLETFAKYSELINNITK